MMKHQSTYAAWGGNLVRVGGWGGELSVWEGSTACVCVIDNVLQHIHVCVCVFPTCSIRTSHVHHTYITKTSHAHYKYITNTHTQLQGKRCYVKWLMYSVMHHHRQNNFSRQRSLLVCGVIVASNMKCDTCVWGARYLWVGGWILVVGRWGRMIVQRYVCWNIRRIHTS